MSWRRYCVRLQVGSNPVDGRQSKVPGEDGSILESVCNGCEKRHCNLDYLENGNWEVDEQGAENEGDEERKNLNRNHPPLFYSLANGELGSEELPA